MPVLDFVSLHCENNGKGDHGVSVALTWREETEWGPHYGPLGGWVVSPDGTVFCDKCVGCEEATTPETAAPITLHYLAKTSLEEEEEPEEEEQNGVS